MNGRVLRSAPAAETAVIVRTYELPAARRPAGICSDVDFVCRVASVFTLTPLLEASTACTLTTKSVAVPIDGDSQVMVGEVPTLVRGISRGLPLMLAARTGEIGAEITPELDSDSTGIAATNLAGTDPIPLSV